MTTGRRLVCKEFLCFNTALSSYALTCALLTFAPLCPGSVSPSNGCGFRRRSQSVRPIFVLTLWTSEGLTQASSQFEGVEFPARPIEDFPESLSQAMLVGCNVSREIGRTSRGVRAPPSPTRLPSPPVPKGSALVGSLQIVYVFLTEGLFGYSHQPTLIFPKVPGRTFFLNLSKFVAFAAAPFALTPFFRNQPVPTNFCRLLS